MRSVAIIAGGLVLLGIAVAIAGRFADGSQSIVTVARIFIAVWLVAALVNMWIGVARAGYSVAEEFPIFLAIFLVPAIVAGFIWWKFS